MGFWGLAVEVGQRSKSVDLLWGYSLHLLAILKSGSKFLNSWLALAKPLKFLGGKCYLLSVVINV